MAALLGYVKMLTSAPTDREIKLRAFEEAEKQVKYHTMASAQHDIMANSWAKKYEKTRAELSESF